MIAVYRPKIAKATEWAVSAPPNQGWEDAVQNIYLERNRVELDFVGGVLADPLAGLAMAERAGAHHSLIDDDGLWIIFASAIVCRDMGLLTGQRFDDGMTVAKAAKAGLMAEGLWDDTDHRSWVHPPIFSPESLAALLHSWPSAAMVGHFASRLVEINRRIAQAREHLQIARKLIQGEPLDDVPLPLNRNSNWKSHLPERGTRNGMEVAA